MNNVMLWQNVILGDRTNRAYNSKGTSVALRQTWSEIGNIRDQQDIKSDTYTGDGGASAARVGNWALLYGSGTYGDYDNESTNIGAAGSFQMEFSGVNNFAPVATCGATNPCGSGTNSYTAIKFVNRQASTGLVAGTGGGNYALESNSPAVNMIPAGRAVLPYDLNGYVRNNSGWGSAGAYEQAIVLSPVFAF